MSKEIKKFEGTGNSRLDAILKKRGLSLGNNSKELLEKERVEDEKKEKEARQVNIMGLVDATGSMTSLAIPCFFKRS